MLLLDASLAQSIVDRTMQILHANVNVMDARGIIIASGDPARIGAHHEGAMMVLAQGRTVEIDDALASRLHDARPGINLPLRADGTIVGVIGLSGAPDAIRQFAELLRMAAETMLEQARLMQVIARDLRLREEFVLQFVGIATPTPALEDWARKLGVDPDLPRVAVLVALDPVGDDATALLAGQQRALDVIGRAEPGALCAPVSLREIVGLLPVSGGGDDPVRLHERVHALLVRLRDGSPLPLRLGLGGVFPGRDGLVRSYQSARTVLRVGHRRQPERALHCYSDQMLAVLLAGLGEGWQADELRRPLQRLAEHDRDGVLRRTLAAWFAHDMKSSLAARALHVHRNTLDYRLRRIGEFSGLDLTHLDDALLLFIALELDQA
ncbi:MAG: sugar diacid recognition domain-containing protein [Thauera propionica]|jgi:carbohydrate diacid regulator|uniref:sugar diacid recognition domain-containing protein n=1 Tax=Thauera propionica TaxID=2019431 RepID=UPI0023EFE546|nr:sugar diacid recognition domain-containing protein [Thauera propionica]MDD3676505.1 sugar diacid recognition domain-containing protein [Thauera propionica]MDY0048244.1 sugar diacid recognition domain-containing protein [Thauera propionica]